jgi:hypothetical protein
MKPLTLAFTVTAQIVLSQMGDDPVRHLRSRNLLFDPKSVERKVIPLQSIDTLEQRSIAAKSSEFERIDDIQAQESYLLLPSVTGSIHGVLEDKKTGTKIISTDQSNEWENSLVLDASLSPEKSQSYNIKAQTGARVVNNANVPPELIGFHSSEVIYIQGNENIVDSQTFSLEDETKLQFDDNAHENTEKYEGYEGNTFEILENRNNGFITHVVIKPPARDASCKTTNAGHTVAHGGKCDSTSLGNTLAAIYMSALRAFQRKNTFSFSCSDGRINRENEVLKTYISGQIWNMSISDNVPDLCQGCDFWPSWPHHCRLGLNYAVPIIRNTLQRIPPPPNIDDVTIHLRCGDILSNVYMRDYGYPRYHVYKEFLTSPFSSIGILTASQDPRKARPGDIKHFASCTAILNDMVHYFQDMYPTITISIRSDDTVAQSIGRMVHSKQFWCNPSSFCVLPAIATTGRAYILQSKLYPFVEEIKGEPRIQIVKRDFLNASQIAIDKMDVSQIISWLRMT